MKTNITTFKETVSHPEQVLAVIFDIEGFSAFSSQPDVQDYITKYLNIVIGAFEICYKGGHAYWTNSERENIHTALPDPIHSKFLGDGALFIWRTKDFKDAEQMTLINRLYNMKHEFSAIVKKAKEEVPVDIPEKIRFGISSGSAFRLTYKTSTKEEYIGYSINLASRLQSYCKDIGFIVSARVNLTTTELENNAYVRQVAIDLRGFPNETVIVDKHDFEKIVPKEKDRLFQPIE